MSEFKKGDRVLVEAEIYATAEGTSAPQVLIMGVGAGKGHVVSYIGSTCKDQSAGMLHPHPGVAPADLVEECELAESILHRCYTDDTPNELMRPYKDLRAARKAAKEQEKA